MARSSKGWGFAIDYAQAIAQDEAQIARLTDPQYVALCASVTDAEWEKGRTWGITLTFFDHVSYDLAAGRWRTAAERAPLLVHFGLTDAEFHALAYYLEAYDLCEAIEAEAPELAAPSDPHAFAAHRRMQYQRGKAAAARTEALRELGCYRNEAGRREALSKARADLARHKRNRAKFGTT